MMVASHEILLQPFMNTHSGTCYQAMAINIGRHLIRAGH
jgi:hypothetical protein